MRAATRVVHLTDAGTTTVIPAGQFLRSLHGVAVNTAAEGATVTLQFADDDAVIAVIDASKASLPRAFHLNLARRGLKVAIVGSPDVTVTYS